MEDPRLSPETQEEEEVKAAQANELAPPLEEPQEPGGVPQELPPEAEGTPAPEMSDPPPAPAPPQPMGSPYPDIDPLQLKIDALEAKQYDDLYSVDEKQIFAPAHRPLTPEGAERYKLANQEDKRDDPTWVELMGHTVTNNFISQHLTHDLTTGFSSQIAMKYLAPEVLQDDPNFTVDETDPFYLALPPHQQRQLDNANNEFTYNLIKNRILGERAVAEDWTKASWPQYISGTVVQFVLEGGPLALAGRGISTVTGAGRMWQTYTAGLAKTAQLAEKSRYLGAIRGGGEALAGASVEAFISYNMNVVSENEALTMAAMGGAFGAGIGGIKPSWMGVHAKEGVVDESLAKAEDIHAKAALEMKRARERGEVVIYDAKAKAEAGDPDVEGPNFTLEQSTDLKPYNKPLDGEYLGAAPGSKNQTGQMRNRVADDADFEDLPPGAKRTEAEDLNPEQRQLMRDQDDEGMDKMMGADKTPGPELREVIFKSDAKQVVRERGQSKNATAHLVNDAEFVDDAFGVPFGIPKRANADTKKLFQDAWRRQGYRNMAPRKVWTIIGKRADRFAADSGDNVRHGWDDPEVARQYLEDGEELVSVNIPEGTKIIEGGDVLADRVGQQGQIMFGAGKVDWKPGKKTAKFHPERKIPKGNPDMLRAKYADGRPMSPEAIRARNEIAEELNMDPERVDPMDMNTSGNGIGADRVMDDSPTVLVSENLEAWAKDPANAPQREYLIGASRMLRMMRSKNPVMRLTARMLFGDTLIKTGADRNKANSGGLSTEQMMRQPFDMDQDLITGIFQEGEKLFQQEMVKAGKPKLKGRKLAHKFSMDLKEWQAYRNVGREADYLKDFGPVPDSIKKAGQKLDDWNKSILEELQDPGGRFGKSGLIDAVAGAEDIIHKPGYFPQQISNGKLSALAREGYTDALVQVLEKALHNKHLQTNPKADPAATKTIARFMANAIRRGGGQNLWGNRTPTFKTVDDLFAHAEATGVTIEPTLRKEMQDSFEYFVGQSKEATVNLKERLNLDMLQKHTIHSKKGDSKDVRLLDLLTDDLQNSHTNYSRTHRGWIAMANSYIPDAKTGEPQWAVRTDPETGEVTKKMVTFNSRQAIDKHLYEVERIHTEMKLDEGIVKKIAFWSKNTDGETSLFRQGDRDILRESMMWMINQSGEKPNSFVQLWRQLTYMNMLGKGGMSSLQESLSYLGRTGVHGAMRYAGDVLDGRLIGHITEQFDGVVRGKYNKSQLGRDQFLNELENFAQGTELRRMQAGATFEHGNMEVSAGMDRFNDTWASFGSYHVERAMNGVFNTGLLVPVHSYFSNQASRAMNDKWGSIARKYKTYDKLPDRWKNRFQDAGFEKEDVADVLKLYNDTAKTRKRLGVTQITDFDKSHPSFKQETFDKILYGLTRETENYGMIEPSYGAKIQGSGTNLGAVVTALKTTQIASGTQMLANWGKSTAENGINLAKNLKKGNIHGPSGALNDAAGLGHNGMYVLAAFTSAYVYAIVRQEYDMMEAGLDDKGKAAWRRNYTNPNWAYREIMDRSGLFSFMPLLFDSLVAPATGSKDWKGFDTSGVKTGFFGGPMDGVSAIGSDMIFGSTPMAYAENQLKGIDSMANHLTGEAEDRDNVQILKMFSNLWWARLALNQANELMDMPKSNPRKFKPTAPHENLTKALTAKRSTSKHVGETAMKIADRADKFFFGDED